MSLAAGVRQGGVLSPLLFTIFIDTVVERVITLNIGCYINCICCSIFLYADDILQLAPTISGLRALSRTCENYSNEVDMCINANKSQCIRFGRRYNTYCAALTTASDGAINWVDCCRYLFVCSLLLAVLSSAILAMPSRTFSERLMLYTARLADLLLRKLC
jgi:Reverse transcriptase (RNA-dependent DNA polymerase)